MRGEPEEKGCGDGRFLSICLSQSEGASPRLWCLGVLLVARSLYRSVGRLVVFDG